VKIDGQEIAYLESPARQDSRDSRPVILRSRQLTSARTWLPVKAGDLGQQFRCLAPDLPGHGQSEPARDRAGYSLPG